MKTDTLVKDYKIIFPNIDLIVKNNLEDDVKDIFNNSYYKYIPRDNYNSFIIKKSFEQLLKKAKKNYREAKKLFHNGRLSENILYEYKSRIQEIINEINNLN